MKKTSIFMLLCLLICAVMSGCLDNSPSNSTDTKPTKITAPVEFDTERPFDTSETEADTEEEETAEVTADTVPEETAENTLDEVTETAPAFDVDNVPFIEGKENVFDLYGALSAGNPIKGEFRSKQSDSLVMAVNFDCQAESDGSVTVRLDVELEVYSINCGARPNLGEITINGVTHKFSTDALSHNGNTKVSLPLTSYTYQSAPEETSCVIDVSWPFNGIFGGEKIEDLTASALLTWVIPADN